MHEEISKHTQKAYNVMNDSKHTFSEKIKEIAIEIFIIVFAVTLSIGLHSWSEARHQHEEAKEFLIDLKKDLIVDKTNLNESKINIDNVIKDYVFLLKLTKKQIDSLKGNVMIPYRSKEAKFSGGNYEGFKSSGKLGFIENKKLKSKILNYYQQSIPEINAVELSYQNKADYFFDNVMFNFSIDAKKKFIDRNTNIKIQLLIGFSNHLLEQYKEALKQINEITQEINTEYKE